MARRRSSAAIAQPVSSDPQLARANSNSWDRKYPLLSEAAATGVVQRNEDFVRRAFILLDTNKDQKLTAQELASVCKVGGLGMTVEEINDVINEYDADASGQLEIEEFLMLTSKYQEAPQKEMEETFAFFSQKQLKEIERKDVDSAGFTTEQLRAGLAKTGIRLAHFELAEMMVGLTQENFISFAEYAKLYGTAPWLRAQAAASTMEQIKSTWTMLDSSGDGSVEIAELLETLMPFAQEEGVVEKMVRVADEDKDGEVSFDEFTKVYHSDEWLNVRLVNMARQTLITAFSDQIALYKRQALEMREHVQDIAENNDKFLSNSEIKEKISPQLLMKRRALQRSKSVRSAMNKFWKALEAHTIAGAYVTKELYLRYNYKLNRAFFDTDEGSRPNTAATDVSGLANAEEDWEAECKRADTLLTKTKHMQHREAKGLPLTEPIPDRVEVLSYSVFFDSIFELADVYIMMQGDETTEKYSGEEQVYVDLVKQFMNRIIEKHEDEDGEAVYCWVGEPSSASWGEAYGDDVDLLNMEQFVDEIDGLKARLTKQKEALAEFNAKQAAELAAEHAAEAKKRAEEEAEAAEAKRLTEEQAAVEAAAKAKAAAAEAVRVAMEFAAAKKIADEAAAIKAEEDALIAAAKRAESKVKMKAVIAKKKEAIAIATAIAVAAAMAATEKRKAQEEEIAAFRAAEEAKTRLQLEEPEVDPAAMMAAVEAKERAEEELRLANEREREQWLDQERAQADAVHAERAAATTRKRNEKQAALSKGLPWFSKALGAIKSALSLAETMRMQGAPGSARMLSSLATQFRSALGDGQSDMKCLNKLEVTVNSVCWMLQARSMNSDAKSLHKSWTTAANVRKAAIKSESGIPARAQTSHDTFRKSTRMLQKRKDVQRFDSPLLTMPPQTTDQGAKFTMRPQTTDQGAKFWRKQGNFGPRSGTSHARRPYTEGGPAAGRSQTLRAKTPAAMVHGSWHKETDKSSKFDEQDDGPVFPPYIRSLSDGYTATPKPRLNPFQDARSYTFALPQWHFGCNPAPIVGPEPLHTAKKHISHFSSVSTKIVQIDRL